MKDVTLFIPTRDSGRWIGHFLDAYRENGIDPLYIVDARTTDNTIKILESKNARFHLCMPAADFVESGMISFAISHIRTPWSLRFDDDEFPSRTLLQNLDGMCANETAAAWFLPRREISKIEDRFVYSRFPARYHYFLSGGKIEWALTPQLRLLRNAAVEFIQEIHTPGVRIPQASRLAANEHFFVHCKNLLLSPSERLNKIINYSHYDTRRAWSATDEYLPEIFDPELFRFSDDGLDEFTLFFERLPKFKNSEFKISEDDFKLASHYTLQHLVNNLHQRHAQIALQNGNLEALKRTCFFLASPLTRRASELTITTGNLLQSEKITGLGKKLYRLTEIFDEKSLHEEV